MDVSKVCMHFIITLFSSPSKKRYTPVITINDSFPICIYEFELVDNILIQEVIFPSVNAFAAELRPDKLCFVVLSKTTLSEIESQAKFFLNYVDD